ncbi:MAG: DNA-3-methyladenine glycosylase [Bdellovibrionales bacterium]|nr:DNA-3-methyladenine glycosylase [Bdellovibrionales bacterium]
MASLLTKSSAKSSAAKDLFQPQKIEGLLDPSFFARNTVEVAQDLLGKVLLVRAPRSGRFQSVRIVETEAYRAGDPASHSAKGKTSRASVMFGPPGHAYVYVIYGMYWMLNFVTEPEGDPGAVLIRAVEPLNSKFGRLKTNGPGKLTRALQVGKRDNGAALNGPRFWVRDDGFEVSSVLCSGRVGISQGKGLFWRFFIEGNLHVSQVKENRWARRVKREREV